MKKYLYLFIFLCPFFWPNQIHAAGLNLLISQPFGQGLSSSTEATEINIDSATINSWAGPSINNLNLAQKTSDPLDLISQSIGEEVTPAASAYYNYNLNSIYDYIKQLATQQDQPGQDASMTIVNNRVTKFTPSTPGIELDIYQTTLAIANALENNQATTSEVLYFSTPNKTLTQTNNLGINELLASGSSNFSGSPQNRRHNIAVGVEKMTGIILAPGEEFSFNKFLGPVDQQHNFLPELVIKGNQTIPEDGGGLCQVSTTAFRAAMTAGLPITERQNHAYAVSYYSPQGTDATIYPGVVDLKFVNNTPAAVLIWPHIEGKNTLIFDFYGTKDDRQVTLEKPVEFDRKTDGSMKASWTRIVTLNGVISTSTFHSVYLPPALFHKTTEYPTTTPATKIIN